MHKIPLSTVHLRTCYLGANLDTDTSITMLFAFERSAFLGGIASIFSLTTSEEMHVFPKKDVCSLWALLLAKLLFALFNTTN